MLVSKFLDPKNDFAFRRVFGAEKNKDILIPFLNAMLEFQGDQAIVDVQFLKTIQDPEIASRKQSIVDVLCTDQKNRQLIVEMQVAHTRGFEKRAQYYAAKAYISQMKQGEQYESLKEVIFLAITDFIMFPSKQAYKSDHIILDKKSHDHDLKDFSFTFLELPKFNKNLGNLSTLVEKWTYFFKHAETTQEGDLEALIGQDPVIERAYQEVNRYAWSEEELHTYEQEEKRERDHQASLDSAHHKGWEKGKEEGREEGLTKGREEGLTKGREEGRKEIAVNLLKLGVPVEKVMEATGLSEKEIKKLA